MSERNGTYETPECREYGPVETLTQWGSNKNDWGTDTDLCIIPIKGSLGH